MQFARSPDDNKKRVLVAYTYTNVVLLPDTTSEAVALRKGHIEGCLNTALFSDTRKGSHEDDTKEPPKGSST